MCQFDGKQKLGQSHRKHNLNKILQEMEAAQKPFLRKLEDFVTFVGTSQNTICAPL